MIDWITIPGLSEYNATVSIMEDKVADIIVNGTTETIYLIEYKDVYTTGASYSPNEIINPSKIPIVKTNRGGKVTYHGPGQRIIYPILNLNLTNRSKDINLYVRMLEEWIINTLREFGIQSYTIKDKIGVWIRVSDQDAKIASIGVRIKKWVTYHGIAINISTDLSNFNNIIPCGIENMISTSLYSLEENISMTEFDTILKTQFYKMFK